jgi:2-polyprenyl-6-hydroxyphenyl methylase / 3-demethylubiquinone-9 3-methyltransferase
MQYLKYMTNTETKLKLLLENTGDMALKRRARNIITGLELKDGDSVLDVGCGDGYYLHLLSNIGYKLKITGTDYSKFDLERAKKNLSNPSIKLVYGDLMKKLPLKDNTFDKVTMSEVCEHLPSDIEGLKEVRRVMKKGATICLTVPCHDYPFLWDPINWTLEKFLGTHVKSGFFAGLWNQHIRLYRVAEIKKVVEKAGFEVKEARALTWWCLPFNHYIVNAVARLLAHGNLPSATKKSLSKYTKNPKRSSLLNIAFGLVNSVDKLNDIFPIKNHGVAVFVRAINK